MHLSSIYLSTLAAFAISANADWTIWSGTCNTFGESTFELNSLGTEDQGECGGCSVEGFDINTPFEAGDPCNCEQLLSYVPTEAGMDVFILDDTHSLVAQCYESETQTGACQGALYSCLKTSYINCISTLCN